MSQPQKEVKNFLKSFTAIFYICKLLGIYPYDFQTFKEEKRLQQSKLGAGIVLAVIVIAFVCFNLMIATFHNAALIAQQNNLGAFITMFLTYIGPAMVIIDQLNAIRNQQELSQLFDDIHEVDEGLQAQDIIVNNSGVTLCIYCMVFVTFACELSIFLATYFIVLGNSTWTNMLWIFTCVPTLYNALDKIWFLGILSGLRQRFSAMNLALDEIVERHEQLQKFNSVAMYRTTKILKKPQQQQQKQHQQYIIEQQKVTMQFGSGSSRNRVTPIIATSENNFGELLKDPVKQKNALNYLSYDSEFSNVAAIEEKLNNLCQLHDSICVIAQKLNELWSYPVLILMAYGFVTFTSMLYFHYCAHENQEIPALFRAAKSPYSTIVYLLYISAKCISLMYCSWKTSLESKRTGICLHRCGVAADTNDIYEIVNHLSLKLLNHAVNFSACGFFTLDMETLFAVCGGITSYLIILIQFNMAGEQVKYASSAASSITTTSPAAMMEKLINAGGSPGNSTSYLNDIFYLWN